MDEQVVLPCLLGYLSAGGHKMRTQNGQRAVTVSRCLAEGVRLLAIGLGYACSVAVVKKPATAVIEGALSSTTSSRDQNRS